MKILYVEDESTHVELTQRTLEDNLQERFVLYHVDSLRGALKMVESETDIDLVLTTLRMPDGSALNLLDKIKELPHAPAVVLIAAPGNEQEAITALKLGAADYLVKDGDYLHRLPTVLKNAVAQNQLAREQAALQAAEHRFRILVEQLPAAVYTDNHDEFESALYISPQIQEIAGYAAADWLAEPKFWWTRVHPDDLAALRHEIKASYDSLADFNMIYRIIHRDGRIVWVKDVAKVILDPQGKPKYWQGILFDITREVEAQATLQASEARFKRIFHSTPIATCVVTLAEGRFVDANMAFVDLVGISLENLVGRTSEGLGFWEYSSDREMFVRQLREQGAIKGQEVRYSNVPEGPKDTLGYYELIELSGTVCILAMFHDVTDQKKAQKALQAEHDFALQVLNNMGQGLTVIDRNSRFEYINPAYANMLGHTVEDLLGRTPLDVVTPDSRATLQQELIRRQQYGITSTYEVKLRHKDGHEVPVVVTGVPRLQHGEQNGAIAVVTDLTVQKETEQALERQVQELTVLHALAVMQAESKSEDEILEKVTKAVSQIYSEICGILTLDQTGTILTPHRFYVGADVSNWQEGYPITEGITGKCVTLGTIIRVGDVTQEPGYLEIASRSRSELCIPIRVHQRIIGVINVESASSDAFTEHDEGFLTIVAGGLGTALERIRLLAEEQRRATELDVLYQATRVMTQSLEPKTIGKHLIQIMENLLGYEYGAVLIVDEAKERIYPLALSQKGLTPDAYARDMEHIRSLDIKRGQGVVGWVIEHGQPIRSGDVSQEPRYLSARQNVRSELCVPLIARNKVIGAINIETAQPNAYSEKDEVLLAALANSAAIAIDNAGLFEAEKQRRQEAETLRQAASAISSTLDPDKVVREILVAIQRIVPYDGGSVFLHEGDKLRLAMAHGYPHSDQLRNLTLPAADRFFQNIQATGKPMILEDAQKDPRFKNWGDANHVRGWMVVPLVSRGHVIGAITLDSRQPGAFDESTAATALAFAHQAAAAIDNARLYDETQRRLSDLEIINHVSTALRNTQAPDEMLIILLDQTLNLLGVHHGSIWLYDPDSNTLIKRVQRGALIQFKHEFPKPSEGIIGHVFSTGRPYISREFQEDPLPDYENLDDIPPGLGGIFLPVHTSGGTLGVLMLEVEKDQPITDRISLLTALAEITGNAIHRAELFEQSQEQIHKLTTLRDIDSAVASSTDLRVTLNILMDHTLRHLKTDAVDILLYHSELQSLTYLTSAGFYDPSPSRPLMRLGEGLAGQVVMKGSLEYIPDLKDTVEFRRDPLLSREGFVSYIGIPLVVKGQIKGVFEVFHRSALAPTGAWMQFLQTLAGQAAIAIDNAQLFDRLQLSNQELTQAYDTTLEGWARALELRDRETEGHTRRVTNITMQLARFMGIADEEMTNIYRGVLLHDIGKMGVSDHILRKTGPLTESEWAEMRRHPEYAFNLLSPIPYLRPALHIPYCHHEHWDGSGYPRGLKGEQIPLAARIFAVVDIWDALLLDRPYRKAWTKDKVIQYLKNISGIILDPQVVSAFLALIEE